MKYSRSSKWQAQGQSPRFTEFQRMPRAFIFLAIIDVALWAFALAKLS